MNETQHQNKWNQSHFRFSIPHNFLIAAEIRYKRNSCTADTRNFRIIINGTVWAGFWINVQHGELLRIYNIHIYCTLIWMQYIRASLESHLFATSWNCFFRSFMTDSMRSKILFLNWYVSNAIFLVSSFFFNEVFFCGFAWKDLYGGGRVFFARKLWVFWIYWIRKFFRRMRHFFF